MNRIAVLGLGAMGARMAQNLIAASYAVVVYNRTATQAQPLVEQGAILAHTPRSAAEQADVVISMVTDDQASQTVWTQPETGALWGLTSGKIAIASSTLTVAWTRALATQVAERGAAFLDAPVLGSRPQAEAGKLIYLVGGAAEVLNQVQPILSNLSGAIHHVGPIGQGMAMKLAVNTLFGIQVAALAEAVGALQHQGIAIDTALDCLGALPITSPAAKGAGALMAKNAHEPLFPIALVAKDFRYGIETAQAAGAETPVAAAIAQVYEGAIEQGLGNANITGVAQLFF